MGLIDIIKPLSTVLNSAVNKSRNIKKNNSWKYRESNLGAAGSEESMLPLSDAAPPPREKTYFCQWLKWLLYHPVDPFRSLMNKCFKRKGKTLEVEIKDYSDKNVNLSKNRFAKKLRTKVPIKKLVKLLNRTDLSKNMPTLT